MARLKAKAKGKAGKHRSQESLGLLKLRCLRVCRVHNETDRYLLGLLRGKESDEPAGKLAGDGAFHEK